MLHNLLLSNMNKNLYRFTGAFVALLGLAYLGHQVFVRASQAPAPAAAAAAPVPHVAADGAPVVSNASAYVVYPDKATDSALGLTYTSFAGDFLRKVIMTPLPPNAAGRTALRIQPQRGRALDLALADGRCASPVQVVVSRVNEKTPVATGALTSAQPKLSVPFADGNVPALLVEAKMDDNAPNNYFCGVAVNWAE